MMTDDERRDVYEDCKGRMPVDLADMWAEHMDELKEALLSQSGLGESDKFFGMDRESLISEIAKIHERINIIERTLQDYGFAAVKALLTERANRLWYDRQLRK